MKFIKYFLLIIFFYLVSSNVFADDANYYKTADIPDTDTINFNWQVNWVNYQVRIDTGEINYITWSDKKIHSCFPIEWTWYTNKLWEIYFQYDWYGSYVCSDYKLRGVFKIWAWGRWHMEDLNNDPEKWKCFLNKEAVDWWYYHNWDWNWNWTWQARLDDIWYANMSTVRTSYNLTNAFYNIKVAASINPAPSIANWTNTWNLNLALWYSWSTQNYLLKNVSLSYIKFSSWINSDVIKNSNTIAGFEYLWWTTTDSNWNISWNIIAFHPWKNLDYKLKIGFWSWEISSTWKIYQDILPPFNPNLYITGYEISNKSLMWYLNKAKIDLISDPNISDLSLSNTTDNISIDPYQDYFTIITWNNIKFDWNYYNLQLNPIYTDTIYYSWDSLAIKYSYNTDYSFSLNWDNFTIKNYTGNTSINYIYKDWIITNIQIAKDTTTNPTANWKTPFWYKIKFLNSKWYPINNISFNNNLNDWEKFFNINSWSTYKTWFFIVSWDSLANSRWIYNLWVISYKPISYDKSAFLTWYIKNISYNWYYPEISSDKYIVLNNLVFNKIVHLDLENKVIPINKETTLNIDFSTDNSDVSNWDFNLTWTLYDCPSCWFKEWKILSWNNFDSKDYYIYITWWNDPSSLVYSWYIWYDLSGSYWNKKVYLNFNKTYTDFIFYWGGTLQVLWNVVSDRKILWWISYISTIINPSVFKNKIRKKIYSKIIRWNNIEKVDTSFSLDISSVSNNVKIYKCENKNIIINLKGEYSWKKSLYFINCQINIDWNIIKNWKWELSIMSFAINNNNIDTNNDNWWIIWWNIYIWPNVKTIQANLITDGSIFTYTTTPFNLNSNTIFFDNRWNNNLLRKQLFIQWKVFSKNTIWWWLQNTQDKYTIIWWKKVSAEWNWFDALSASTIAKAYDMKFWRNDYVKTDWTYDTGDLSELIYNKYHCTWNVANDKTSLCSKTIVIMDEK